MLVFTHVANGWNDEVTWPDLAQTEAVRTKCSSEIRNWNNDKVRAAIVLICQEEITLWWKLLIASRPPPVILCDFRGWSEAVLSRNMLWVQKQLNKRGSRGSFSWSRVSGNTVLLLCASTFCCAEAQTTLKESTHCYTGMSSSWFSRWWKMIKQK